MKLFALFCVILFACGSTAVPINDLSEIEHLVSNELGHESYALAEIILRILEQFRGIINDAVKELLENQRHLILTGIPPTIPILDPFFIDELSINPTEQIEGFASFQMKLSNTNLKGLYDFKIDQVDIRPLGLFGMVTFSFDKLEMEGLHSTNATLLQALGITVAAQGNGPYTMTLNNFTISAYVQIEFNGRIRPNLKTVITAYSVSTVDTNFTGFPVLGVNALFNRALSAVFPSIVLLSNVNANLWLNDEFIPAVNGVINDFNIIDIIGLIRTLIRNNAESFDLEIMDALYRYEQSNKNL